MNLFNKILILMICFILWAGSSFAEQAQLGIIINTGEDKGCFSWIQERMSGPSRPAMHNIMTTIADIHAASYGENYFILEGEGVNQVTKYNIATQDDPEPEWQYSAISESESITKDTLPIDILFIDTNKAYLLRYASPEAWIINPSADEESSFYSGTINLDSYNDNDGSPEMTCGIAVGEKAFIVLKRMDATNDTYDTAYIAVIDINTDSEIDIGIDTNLNGIPLNVKNPVSIHYLESTDKLYVLGTLAGDSWGGIEEIDPNGYTQTVIIEGTSQKYFTEMALIAEDDGFILAASSPDVQTVCHLNLSEKTIKDVAFNTTVTGYLENKKLRGMALDQHDKLWLANQTDRTIHVINSASNNGLYTCEETIEIDSNYGVEMYPKQITFCMEADTDEESRKPSSAGESGNFCFIETLR